MCRCYMIMPTGDDNSEMSKKTAIKTYDIFEAGIYIGTLNLTPDQVRVMTAKAEFILKEKQ